MNGKQKEDYLILIDGTAYLYRAYHALPPLKNSNGENTGAIHGFLKALNKIIEDFNPKHIGVVFDAKGKTSDTQYMLNIKQTDPQCLRN